jgi:hypothetical protein
MIHEKQAGSCKRGLACFAVFILARPKAYVIVKDIVVKKIMRR